MTDKKFTELVNLYFDREISAEELEWLKSEIAACPERKRAFAERCRLDKAMRLALKPQRARRARSGHAGRSAAGRGRSSSSSSSSRRSRSKSRAGAGPTQYSRFEASARSINGGGGALPRWVLGSGVAASLALGFLLLTPVFRDTVAPGALPALVGIEEEELQEDDPLDSLGRSGLRRYAAAQQQAEAKYHASLVAQMRLMGLRPELTPEDKELREVGLPAYYEPKHQVSQAELFQRIQAQKVMPEPALLRLNEGKPGPAPAWSGAFEVSPVRFE